MPNEYSLMGKKSRAMAPEKERVFEVLFVFLICAFIGWIIETTGVAISQHAFKGRGYLFDLGLLTRFFPALETVPILRKMPLLIGLPLIEMYGFGGVYTIFVLGRLKHRPIWLFLTGMVTLTLFELLTSYFCSYVLHRNFWDYSKNFINFQGRICLSSALAWGAGSVLSVKVLSPLLRRLYVYLLPKQNFLRMAWFLIVITLLCAMAKYWWFPDILARQS